MSTKVYIVLVALISLVVLAALFFNSGMKPTDNTVHQCRYSTNLNDLFCKETR